MQSLLHSAGALEQIKARAQQAATQTVDRSQVQRHILIDVAITFIGASALPKMDVVGKADPYFIATIDDKIKLISSVQPSTLTPVWNEIWRVKNVTNEGKLKIAVWDKDDGSPMDDFIGQCETDLSAGARELDIIGPAAGLKRIKGTLWVKVDRAPASSLNLLPYTFDGPLVYSRHFSPTVGLLTNSLDDNGRRLYSTWEMRLKGIQTFLSGPLQHWNTNYLAAQRIFGPGPASMALRASIQTGHRLLYARSTTNAFGTIDTQQDVLSLLTGGRKSPHRVKPAVYTYIISVDDDTFRFSETGAAFLVDFASKHALHANCAENVRYSGEFHPRPVTSQGDGWTSFDETVQNDPDVQWELVFDNNSGTYTPSKQLLPNLKSLLEYNFPGFNIIALDREDPGLEKSREACRTYALKIREEGTSELQPHVHVEGEETLSSRASISIAPVGSQNKKSMDDADESDFGVTGQELVPAYQSEL
ncbi:hypothetical protein Clacol_005972 [Clathrus columnatus]|uniref:C2 domain-containing protein n=1 Tax=Clathrus columnatus TaxID=1419009 RepID=A0AAV5AEX3_9AGAM|nr:hypothetical protein Clacol_005972 [Clathrus columnatus]